MGFASFEKTAGLPDCTCRNDEDGHAKGLMYLQGKHACEFV